VGINAGRSNQGVNSTAIGNGAGETSQGIDTVAVGVAAGNDSQGNYATAVGVNAGQISQGVNSTAIGNGAGQTSQGLDAVAVGVAAGNGSQGLRAVSVGAEAGQTAQGNTAIAIGYKAGKTNQAANSIAINASLSMLYANVSGLYINPVRQDDSNVANVVYYNTTTKEITYGPSAGTYSNVQVATYLPTYSGNIGNISFSDADDVGGLTHTIKGHLSYISLNAPDNTRLASAGGNVEIQAGSPQWRYDTFGNLTLPSNIAAINYANGVSILSGLGSSSYSNVQVATYLPTYSGNISANGINANTVTATYNITANTIHALANVKIGGSGLDWTEPALQINGYVNINGNIDVYGRAQLGNIKLQYGTLLSDTSNGEFLVGGNITANNITVGNIAGNVAGFAIGYRDVPQITVANLTLIASDAGKHYYGANTNPTTITIPTNANV
jgi:hypothetical protein